MNDHRLEAFVRRTTLRQVEVIVALQEHKSMTAVAAALGMSVANVSRVATRFENNFGVRILEDESRRTALTADSGRIFDVLKPLHSEIGHLRGRLGKIETPT
jgi:DNA-binding transcriptional LysR family regulator